MISYKEYLLASNIGLVINESYDVRRVNFFDLLMEAPIDDATLSKMIASKKGVSIYYQGDEKNKKGWYAIEPIRVDTKGGGKYLLAFVVPKDGSKATLQYFSQPKIVNWNVLGKKDADLAAQYKKKLVTFFNDPKIPKEKKQSFADSLKKVGVKVTDLVKKGLIGAAIVGSTLGAVSKGSDVVQQSKRDTEYSKVDIKAKVSSQVQDQINYLKDNKILEKEYFTILDDKNSIVYAIAPGYRIVKEFKVITGRDVGDELKTSTIIDFAKDNWKGVLDKFFSSPKKAASWLDKKYFDLPEWQKRNTPSGVFRRAGNVTNFLNDKIATTFMQKDYGKRYITWETLNGKIIPFGFHGTESNQRIKKLNAEDIKGAGLNVSFGCINFNERDIQEINDFVSSGQVTIWLPDATNDIVRVPADI